MKKYFSFLRLPNAWSKPKAATIFWIGLVTLALSIFVCFRIPSLYPIWPRLGLEPVALFVNPHDPDLFFAIGESTFGRARKIYDTKKAEAAYARAIELRPDFLKAHYQIGRIYFLGGRFDSALAEMNTVLRLDPEFEKAYYMKGLILGYAGKLTEATEYFEQYIERDETNWAGYNDLAWLHFQLGDYRETLAAAEAGLVHSPENVWLLNMHGLALLNLDRKTEARESFIRAKTLADEMEPSDWGGAYPGNDPAIYAEGLERMREAINHNLALLAPAENTDAEMNPTDTE